MLKKFTKKDLLVFAGCIGLSIYAISYNQQIQAENAIYFPRPLSDDDIKKYSNTDTKAIFIYPIFTQIAYKPGGFYDYFKGICPTCNTVTMLPYEINATYPEGLNSFQFLTQLHYPFITDAFVDQHPDLLKEYDKVILLHNEYVTQNEFDAISNHPNVIYLYPNSLYGKISVDYTKNTITILKGHGVGGTSGNGFGYVTTSKNEYDLNCKNYKWEAMPNGIQLTCWPEFLIKSDRSLLGVINNFPEKTPPLISLPSRQVNVSDVTQCDYYGHCIPMSTK